MEKYTIDLDTILQILQGFHQSGTLYGDLPARKLDNKVPWKAELRLFEGKVISCSILNEKGAAVWTGESALSALCKTGQLNWTMIQDSEQTSSLPAIRQDRGSGPLSSNPRLPAAPRSSDPRFPAVPRSSDPRFPAVPRSSDPRFPAVQYGGISPYFLVPRRLLTVTTEQMSQGRWPRNHRMVYAMTDGVRTIEKIAGLLTLPPDEVEHIARDLYMMRIIVLE